jgi:hypothetical protein
MWLRDTASRCTAAAPHGPAAGTNNQKRQRIDKMRAAHLHDCCVTYVVHKQRQAHIRHARTCMMWLSDTAGRCTAAAPHGPAAGAAAVLDALLPLRPPSRAARISLQTETSRQAEMISTGT